MIHIGRLLVLLVLAALPAGAVETKGPFTCEMGREYFLQFPDSFDPARTYWLVAVAHGFGGNGKAGLSNAAPLFKAGLDDFIVVSPSYPPRSDYILLGSGAKQQLLGLIQKLSGEYKLHPRIFLAGFSGGSQFSHRFAMAEPQLVVGCAAHSGGSWGPGVNKRALHIPFAVSCGLDDIGGDMGSRIENARIYFEKLVQDGYHVQHRFWPGVGHTLCDGARKMTVDCYLLATRGLFAGDREALDAEVERIRGLAGADAAAAAGKVTDFKPERPAPKALRVAALKEAERDARREELGRLGLGGRSKNGKDYWVDDANENQHGWIDTRVAAPDRTARLRAYLSGLSKALAGESRVSKP